MKKQETKMKLKPVISGMIVGQISGFPYDLRQTREPTLADKPDRLNGVWRPLEAMLAAIEQTGEIDSVRGKPVFFEGGQPYEAAPALRGVIEFNRVAADRFGIPINLDALAKLANRLEYGVPLAQPDIDSAKDCIARCKQQVAHLTISQAESVLSSALIAIALGAGREAA